VFGLAKQSPELWESRAGSDILYHRNFWTAVRSLVLSSECSPTGLMLIEEVPIDSEVMAAIEGLVYNVEVEHHAGVQVQ